MTPNLDYLIKLQKDRVTIAQKRYHAIAAIDTKGWINLLLLSVRLLMVMMIR